MSTPNIPKNSAISSMSVRARRMAFEGNNDPQNQPMPSPTRSLAQHKRITTQFASRDKKVESSPRRKPLNFLSDNIKKRISPKKQQQLSPSILMKGKGFSKKAEHLLHESFEIEQEEEILFQKAETSCDNVEKLRNEITDMQQRIQSLDSNAESRDELLQHYIMLSSTPEKQELRDEGAASTTKKKDKKRFLERTNHEEHLRRLNKKLIQIQVGLSEIEGERLHLTNKAETMEIEKTQLMDQLAEQDYKIIALTQKCKAGEDKIMEASQLKSINKELQIMVVELKGEIASKNTNKAQALMEQQVVEQQEYRNVLQIKFDELETDYKIVCDSLVKCAEAVKRLTDDKETWEEERNRIQRQYELHLEQQRLDHIRNTVALKDELKLKQIKITELDNVVQDKVVSIQLLRDQLSASEAGHAEALQNMAERYEEKLNDASQSHKDSISQMQAKILAGKSEIGKLRDDMSAQMQELMTATAELQKLQENSKLLDNLMVDVETLEHDRYCLQDTLHDKDTEVAELQAEILKFQIEKELYLSNVETTRALEIKCVDLETQVAAQQGQHRQMPQHVAGADIATLNRKIEELKLQLVSTNETNGNSQRALKRQLADQSDEHREEVLKLMQVNENSNALVRRLEQQLKSHNQSYENATLFSDNGADSRDDPEQECRSLRQQLKVMQLEKEKISAAFSEMQRSTATNNNSLSLHNEIVVSEKKAVEQDEHISKLEEALSKRTKQLHEMNEQNKEIQEKLEKGNTDYSAMEERSSVLQVRLLDKEEELARLTNQWQYTEDKYLGDIQDEKHLRQRVEVDLASAKARLDSIVTENRNVIELEKENSTLKDKIRRQEAFLKRKLEQESRNRGVGCVVTTSLPAVPAMISPLHSPHRVSRVVTNGRRGIESTGKLNVPSSSKATVSTEITSDNSFDVDLDAILS